MLLLAPPAPARRLNRDHGFAGLFPIFVAALPARIKVLVEIGDRRVIHGIEVGRPSRILNRVTLPPHHSAETFHSFSTVQSMDHLGERNLSVAAVYIVHLRAPSHDFVRDVVLKAGSAE